MKSPIYIISLYLQYINILNIHVLVKVYSGLIANNTKIFDVVQSFPHITWESLRPQAPWLDSSDLSTNLPWVRSVVFNEESHGLVWKTPTVQL